MNLASIIIKDKPKSEHNAAVLIRNNEELVEVFGTIGGKGTV